MILDIHEKLELSHWPICAYMDWFDNLWAINEFTFGYVTFYDTKVVLNCSEFRLSFDGGFTEACRPPPQSCISAVAIILKSFFSHVRNDYRNCYLIVGSLYNNFYIYLLWSGVCLSMPNILCNLIN